MNSGPPPPDSVVLDENLGPQLAQALQLLDTDAFIRHVTAAWSCSNEEWREPKARDVRLHVEMALVLICSPTSLEGELGDTLLWRDDVVRRAATSLDEARTVIAGGRPDLVLVDRDLPESVKLVAALRRDPETRRVSIVAFARGDFDPLEVELLEAGANAVLRLPPGPEWDERLVRLLSVPGRKDVRFPMHFEIEARSSGEIDSGTATALNLSVSGMLIECGYKLAIGDDLDFSFRLPGLEEPITGCGRVVRRARGSQVGIEFYGLEGDGADAVRYYLGTLPSP